MCHPLRVSEVTGGISHGIVQPNLFQGVITKIFPWVCLLICYEWVYLCCIVLSFTVRTTTAGYNWFWYQDFMTQLEWILSSHKASGFTSSYPSSTIAHQQCNFYLPLSFDDWFSGTSSSSFIPVSYFVTLHYCFNSTSSVTLSYSVLYHNAPVV